MTFYGVLSTFESCINHPHRLGIPNAVFWNLIRSSALGSHYFLPVWFVVLVTFMSAFLRPLSSGAGGQGCWDICIEKVGNVKVLNVKCFERWCLGVPFSFRSCEYKHFDSTHMFRFSVQRSVLNRSALLHNLRSFFASEYTLAAKFQRRRTVTLWAVDVATVWHVRKWRLEEAGSSDLWDGGWCIRNMSLIFLKSCIYFCLKSHVDVLL